MYDWAHQKRPSDVTAKRPGTEEKAFRSLNLFELNVRHDPPPHELEVEVNCLVCQQLWVHERTKISYLGRKLALGIPLPSNARWCFWTAWLRRKEVCLCEVVKCRERFQSETNP